MLTFAALLFVLADPPPGSDPARNATTETMAETIVVTAERLEQPWQESTAAVTVLSGEELRALPAETLGDALRLVPGLQVTTLQPGAPAIVSSRGFFGAGEVEYVRLVVDGVPAADIESGLADWRAIPIEAIDRVEVLRGAGSSLFGDTALGGVVQVFRKPATHASLSAGSFGTARFSGAFAEESWQFGASGSRTNGFREHSESREVFAHAAFERAAWRVSLDASDRDREDPGVAGAEEVFRFDGEEVSRLRASVRHRGLVDVAAWVQARDGETVRSVLLAPGFGDRALRELSSRGVGASASHTRAVRSGRVAGGVELSRDSLRSDYFAFEETRGERVAHGSGARLSSAAFVTGEWPLSAAVRVAGGIRWDSIDDTFESIDADDRAFSPRLGVSFDAGGVTAYVQASRAFKTPTLDQRFDQRAFFGFTISNPELRAQRSNNFEAGVRGRAWELIAYVIDVDDEIDFDVRTFRYANIGRSRHRGVEAAWRGTNAHASYTWTRVGEDTQFKNIAEHVLRAGYHLRTVVDLYAGLEHSAGRYLDDANRLPLDDATLVELRVARTFGPLTASVEVTNLLDEDYAPIGFDLEGVPFVYPAAGRAVALGVTWRR